ncbi:hypothetical protein OZN62_08095 [Aurantiacibacter sp. MUD11]|uniref:hypothetical protein n=1 Tax=Aurantiacibacter sp. MUD11 TaxID=3003265 RepID=UPI0022AA368D|nr:hypothetical protein [Aurantiacibacter sp. MUD11]WAT16900.1 hypothetical protein OZN62_08095 [Aurantiacibacter sp. MUD11]
MGKVTRLDPKTPRRLDETVFTGNGLRLAPQVVRENVRWFGVTMVVLPLGAFWLVFFW